MQSRMHMLRFTFIDSELTGQQHAKCDKGFVAFGKMSLKLLWLIYIYRVSLTLLVTCKQEIQINCYF